MVERLAAIAAVPGVDLRLQRVAARQQRPVPGCEVPDQRGETLPERRRVDARTGGASVATKSCSGRAIFRPAASTRSMLACPLVGRARQRA